MSLGDRLMSKLHFERKAMPVIPEHRPMYKICQVLLILDISSSGGKSSLIRLHLFNWALKDDKRVKMLINSAENKMISFGVWGMDPVLNMALNFATAENLVAKITTGYQITSRGKQFLLTAKVPTLFDEEVAVLNVIKKRITENMVKEVARKWKNEV